MRMLLERTQHATCMEAGAMSKAAGDVAERMRKVALLGGGSNDATAMVVNTGGGHWITVATSGRQHTIRVYCSLGRPKTSCRAVVALWQLVMHNLSGVVYAVEFVSGPRQSGGHSCGPLALHAAQCWLQGWGQPLAQTEERAEQAGASSVRRARLLAAVVLGAHSVHTGLAQFVRTEGDEWAQEHGPHGDGMSDEDADMDEEHEEQERMASEAVAAAMGQGSEEGGGRGEGGMLVAGQFLFRWLKLGSTTFGFDGS
jgi:hypothetical protein